MNIADLVEGSKLAYELSGNYKIEIKKYYKTMIIFFAAVVLIEFFTIRLLPAANQAVTILFTSIVFIYIFSFPKRKAFRSYEKQRRRHFEYILKTNEIDEIQFLITVNEATLILEHLNFTQTFQMEKYESSMENDDYYVMKFSPSDFLPIKKNAEWLNFSYSELFKLIENKKT